MNLRMNSRELHRLLSPICLTLCFGFLLLAPCPASAQKKETFNVHHVAKLRYVLSADISPDGKQIAYTLVVPRVLPEDKDGGSYTELHVVDARGDSRGFVTGEVNVSGVAWVPGSEDISFLTKREGDKTTALYVISTRGGEARKVLDHDTSISSYSWSPDGKQVAFLATEKASDEEEAEKKKGFNQEIYEEGLKFTRVWIASVGDKSAKPRMLKLEGSASELHWSPRGNQLALALSPLPLIDHYFMFRKVKIVDVKSGKITASLDNPGKMGAIAWSPDGKHVGLVAGVDKHDPLEGHLWVAPAAGGKWKELTPKFKGHVTRIDWVSNKSLYYLADTGVQSTLAEVSIDGDTKTILPAKGPVFTGMSVSGDGKTIALVGETSKHPSEVFLFRVGDKMPKQLTDSNPWLANMRFAKQEVIKHKARDGLELEGILIRPLDEKKGMRYPLILAVHGGPESHIPNGWLTRYAYPGQVGAAEGFAVFYPNYRGSTGRGVEFSKLGQADAAGKEFDDLVDAVDHLVETGLVDKKKVGITGGSYGGYASAWGATYYSDRFAASVMFVGISDGISKTGTTDIPHEMNLVHHRKWLWEDWDYFIKSSPIRYVEKAKTPLLILHGKEDPRVHPGQSMELFRHLKVRKQAPVRLVFYPGEGHGNRRAASRLDYNLRMMRWFNHYLKGPGGEPPPRGIDYGFKDSKKSK